MTKILKIAISDTKKNKESKIKSLVDKIDKSHKGYFAPTMLLKLDDNFIKKLS
jgi:hypothetical protein